MLKERRLKASQEDFWEIHDLTSIVSWLRLTLFQIHPILLLYKRATALTYLAMQFKYAPSSLARMVLKKRLRASDLALHSPFNRRNSRPDCLLARSNTNVTNFYDNDEEKRVSLLCTFCLREIKCLCGFIFCLKRRVKACKDFSGLYDLTLIVSLLRSNFVNYTLILLVF